MHLRPTGLESAGVLVVGEKIAIVVSVGHSFFIIGGVYGILLVLF